MKCDFQNDLATYIRSGYPIITILSSEEDRVLDQVEAMLNDRSLWKRRRPLFIWTISRGFVNSEGQPVGKDDTLRPEAALMFIAKIREPAVFLFKDFHPYLKDDAPNASLVIRLIRDILGDLKSSGKTLLWVSPVLRIAPELEKDVTVLDMPLPEETEYNGILESLIDRVKDNPRIIVNLNEDDKDKLVKACQGLTRCEAENAMYKAVVSRGRLDSRDVDAILSEKEQIIRKSGILEYTASVESFGSVGGLGNLKKWLRQRNSGFTQKARDFGLPNPRGVLLVGVPGCGKSLCAKAVAAEWQKPLLKFDIGRVFGKYVGESEERMRKAIAVAEGVAPAILWVDELEKALAGATGGGGDSGVSSRVFGSLLTWMEEKDKPVFVVATANDISRIPPELLRKGRMDEIFFVDLPTPQERAEILAIHLTRRQRDPAEFDITEAVRATDGFSGAELEEVVGSALYAAFAEVEKRLTTSHLVEAAKEIIPLSRSRRQEIEALRHWASQNCRMASLPADRPSDPHGESLSERRGRMLEY
jgi:ATP-dependent 26S proteasome regulatory subunit